MDLLGGGRFIATALSVILILSFVPVKSNVLPPYFFPFFFPVIYIIATIMLSPPTLPSHEPARQMASLQMASSCSLLLAGKYITLGFHMCIFKMIYQEDA